MGRGYLGETGGRKQRPQAGFPREGREGGWEPVPASKKKEDPLAPLKEAIARELGLWEKVQARGWGGLSAAETGRLGGLLYHRTRAPAPREPPPAAATPARPGSEHKEDQEVSDEQHQAERDAGTGPLPAADAELARRDDVGDVAGDEHAP